MEKLYLVRVKETGEIYGWTQSKKLAKEFVRMRKPGYFSCQTKKFDTENSIAQFELGRFRSTYRNLQIFMNILGGENESINFPTTYEENFVVQDKCDKMFDELIRLSREICAYPLTDRVREAVEYLSWYATNGGGKNIYCDTFEIFMYFYKDTVI